MSADSSLANRQHALQTWAVQQFSQLELGDLQEPLVVVSGDASFRRYFRGTSIRGASARGSNFQGANEQTSYILVDAPPGKEDSKPFVEVAQLLLAAGVRVPRIVAVDLTQGFMLLEDFGDALLWPVLENARLAGNYAEALQYYQRCFAELLLIQQTDPPINFPQYDAALLRRELRLFTEWFCSGLLQLTLSSAEQQVIEDTFEQLIVSAQQQPQVLVHRDYHSRNLMLLNEPGSAIGVIDFQDAVVGPWTYDVVSLLKDCYIEWPRPQVNVWALQYAAQAINAGVFAEYSEAQVLSDFDLMGAQRHLKVLGIFSRLWLRDGKAGYLKDIPLTFRYVQQVMAEHSRFAAFNHFLQQRIAPQLPAAIAAAQSTGRTSGVLT